MNSETALESDDLPCKLSETRARALKKTQSTTCTQTPKNSSKTDSTPIFTVRSDYSLPSTSRKVQTKSSNRALRWALHLLYWLFQISLCLYFVRFRAIHSVWTPLNTIILISLEHRCDKCEGFHKVFWQKDPFFLVSTMQRLVLKTITSTCAWVQPYGAIFGDLLLGYSFIM